MLPEHEQDRLGQVLMYLLKYLSGVDSQGNLTNRYGSYQQNLESFHRRIAQSTL